MANGAVTGVLNRESWFGVWGSIYGLAVLALIQPKGLLPSGNAQWNHEVDQFEKSVTPAKTKGGEWGWLAIFGHEKSRGNRDFLQCCCAQSGTRTRTP